MDDKAKKLSLDNYVLGKEVVEAREAENPDAPKGEDAKILKKMNLDEQSGNMYEGLSMKEKEEEFERQKKELEQERDEELKRLQNKVTSEVFEEEQDYLSMFEEHHQRQKAMQEVFYEQMNEEEDELQMKKPALFRKSKPAPVEHVKSVNEEFQNMSSEHKRFEEMKKQFHVSEDKNQVDYMNTEVFKMMYKGLKERQLKFNVFLNKEFNILNYKSARCWLYCFEDKDSSVLEANKWVQLCREGIMGCKEYAEKLQKQAGEEVKECQKKAKDVMFQSDPVIHWVSWYEKLVLRFDDMEKDIKSEFSNFI